MPEPLGIGLGADACIRLGGDCACAGGRFCQIVAVDPGEQQQMTRVDRNAELKRVQEPSGGHWQDLLRATGLERNGHDRLIGGHQTRVGEGHQGPVHRAEQAREHGDLGHNRACHEMIRPRRFEHLLA